MRFAAREIQVEFRPRRALGSRQRVTWDELLSWHSAQEHLRELAAGTGTDELHPSSAAAQRLVAALDADADPEALAELATAADPGPWRAAVEAALAPTKSRLGQSARA
jgi:hypothetical protein